MAEMISEVEEKHDLDLRLLRKLWDVCDSRDRSAIVDFLKEHFDQENREIMLDYLMKVRVDDLFLEFERYESALGRSVRLENTKLFYYLSDIGVLQQCVNKFGFPIAAMEKEKSEIGEHEVFSLVSYAAMHSYQIFRLLLECDNLFLRLLECEFRFVCRTGNVESIRMILTDHRIDQAHAGFRDECALHFTAQDVSMSNFSAFCLVLCTTHKDKQIINTRDWRGRTPLHWVTEYGNDCRWLHRILLLLAFGADTGILDNENRSYLDNCHRQCVSRDIEPFLSPQIRDLIKDIVIDFDNTTRQLVTAQERLIDGHRLLESSQTKEIQKLKAENEQLREENEQRYGQNAQRAAFVDWFQKNFGRTKYARKIEKFIETMNDDLVFWVEFLLGSPDRETVRKVFEEILKDENPNEIRTFSRLFAKKLRDVSLAVFFRLKGISGMGAEILEEQGYSTLDTFLSSEDMGILIHDGLLIDLGIESFCDRMKIMRILDSLGSANRVQDDDGEVEEEGIDFAFGERIPNSTLGARMG